MKEYENAYRIYLPRRLPVIIRVDMRAGHTYTQGFVRPFDSIFHDAMVETAQELCKSVDGCKFAYTQSDEISLLVTNDDTIETQPWFNNNLQKIVSLSAAIASVSFQRAMNNNKRIIDTALRGTRRLSPAWRRANRRRTKRPRRGSHTSGKKSHTTWRRQTPHRHASASGC